MIACYSTNVNNSKTFRTMNYTVRAPCEITKNVAFSVMYNIRWMPFAPLVSPIQTRWNQPAVDFPHVSESRHWASVSETVSHLCLFFAGVGICQRAGDTLTAAVILRFLRSVNFPRPSAPPEILLLFLFSVCINNGWPQHSRSGWLTAVSSADLS